VSISSFFILRKLGNYPAISLLQKKKGITDYKKLLGGLSSLESYVLESINTRNFFNEEYLLTNFQRNVSDLITAVKGLSVSAPTSAGKSFIFLKIILDQIVNYPGVTAIYIVPTRALIRQVMNDFLTYIQELNLKNINVSCSSETENLIKKDGRSNILVLTQERLYHLCADIDSSKKLNTKIIVIDEAHNIQSGGRGILLENSIKFAQSLWPTAKVLFSSPLVENPEKLLEIFEIHEGVGEKETLPLVRQNLIKVNVSKNQLSVNTFFEDDEDEIEIGKIEFTRDGKSEYKLLADVTSLLWNQQTSIIYASEPMKSTDVIRALCNSGKFDRLNNGKLDEFADYIEEYISKDYELAQFIRCGLAFHFGSLPPIIRSGIEDLFKSGDLNIVSCTSTLLEGMNMPAKNIFAYKPEKGNNEPIDKLNFWNLAGRAGRMGNDFSGNIICIELDKWETNPTTGARGLTITSATEKILKNDSDKFKQYLLENDTNSKLDDYNEQMISVILNDRMRGKKLEGSIYADEFNEKNLIEIDKIAESMIEEFLPPLELLHKIPGIMPQRINELWRLFQSVSSEIEDYFPVYPVPSYGASYKRFKLIVKISGYLFENDEWNDKFINMISMNGFRWMLGDSLSSIIFYNNSSQEKKGKHLTSLVKTRVEFLNNMIRYKIVKYTQVYTEVLKAYLQSIGKKDEAEKLVNLSAYLEYGACTIPALEFMAIGLPREAATFLAKEIGYLEVYSSEVCLDWLKKLNVNNLTIKNYLKNQIKTVQRTL
jgi:superfamily II DNA/RNA helicase